MLTNGWMDGQGLLALLTNATSRVTE